MRGALCVVVRDLIVYGVLTRHDEGPARDLRDVLELRRGRAPLGPRARRHARGAAQARRAVRAHRAGAAATRPRPYEIVVLSDHGQTQGATFKQRNGYGLDELVERSLDTRRRDRRRRRRREPQQRWSATRSARRPAARRRRSARRTTSPTGTWSCSAPGNLGLVYLMERAPPADARGDRRAAPAPARRRCAATPTSAGCSSARREHGAVALGANGTHYLADGTRRGRRPARALLAERAAAPAAHRTASSTSPTSWSAASTTRRWTRAARSRS